MRLPYLFILTAAYVLAGCSGNSDITITNGSPGPVTNVVVSGSGFSKRIDSIAAGTDKTITVHVKGESGLRVAFDANGKHIDADDLAYLETGDDAKVMIDPDLRVSAK